MPWEALISPASNGWLAAVRVEMSSMARNQVWGLINLLPRCKTIRNKWILKIKQKADELIDIYKACAVMKGYN